MTKALTAKRLDKLMESVTPSNAPSRDRPRIIWTLPAIGRHIGVGPDFIRDTLAKMEGTPVREIGGRYYAFEEELIEFLRRNHVKP